jgi:hypothetical protein
MMAAIRVAFRLIWESDLRRTYVQSKLLDFALVLGVGVVAVATFGASLLVNVLSEIGRDLSEIFGTDTQGSGISAAAEVLASTALTYGLLLVLYRTLPPPRDFGRSGFPLSSPRSCMTSRLPCTRSTSPNTATSPRSTARSERCSVSARRVRRDPRRRARCRVAGAGGCVSTALTGGLVSPDPSRLECARAAPERFAGSSSWPRRRPNRRCGGHEGCDDKFDASAAVCALATAARTVRWMLLPPSSSSVPVLRIRSMCSLPTLTRRLLCHP